MLRFWRTSRIQKSAKKIVHRLCHSLCNLLELKLQLLHVRYVREPLKGGDVGYRMDEKHSTIMKIQTMPCHFCRYCLFFDTVKLSWILFSKQSCVEDLFGNHLLLYKRFWFHLRSPWKISSCRCLLSPFIARSLGRTCRFRRSSHREPVVVAGRGILPRKGTNIHWKWIIGRWNGPWNELGDGRWNLILVLFLMRTC